MAARRAASFALAVLAACVTHTRRVDVPGAQPVAAGLPDQMQAIARQALALDAAGDRAADTLYAPDGYGGRITVAAATVTLEGRFAWVMVDYRWTSSQQNVAEAGRATFICEDKPKGWRIVHVHSSQLLPWDR